MSLSAERFELALGAPGLADDADGAAKVDDLVSEVDPLVLRNELHNVLLGFLRLNLLR